MLLMSLVGTYVRYPVIVILVILAIILYHSDITLRFRHTHSMKTLRTQEQHNWPAISPVVKLDLANEDINSGLWAMALSPMDFARKYQLLRKHDPLLENVSLEDAMTATIERGEAKRVFTLQLGPYYYGPDRCPGHVRALMAVFLARINRDRSAAGMILAAMDRGCAENKMNYAIANATLQKYKNNSKLKDISARHAYVLTVMAELLQSARVDGVVPSAEFLWLKPIDRRLWYMLNCVGRQTPFVEVSGPFAHWKAETAMGRPSLVPMIDEAIKALEIAVKEVKLSYKELQSLKP
jgi:intracellular multiplication protein IcmP